jgi:hypothetical protein
MLTTSELKLSRWWPEEIFSTIRLTWLGIHWSSYLAGRHCSSIGGYWFNIRWVLRQSWQILHCRPLTLTPYIAQYHSVLSGQVLRQLWGFFRWGRGGHTIRQATLRALERQGHETTGRFALSVLLTRNTENSPSTGDSTGSQPLLDRLRPVQRQPPIVDPHSLWMILGAICLSFAHHHHGFRMVVHHGYPIY